ncbi:MAG: flagella basal body P-ring formation protein FlgA [Acidobacteria bacterium]|nr:flagella basal body P-ring formation protein FlgA [Acidobacteriota bacterium]
MRITSLPSKFLILAAGLLAASAVAAAPLNSGCRPTPEEALASLRTTQQGGMHGYRVANLRWDPFLQQQWAIVVSCAHPELPPLTLRVPGQSNRYTGPMKFSSPAVRNGDRVRLWSQDSVIRVEMAGLAEGNAAVGDRIRIRVTHPLALGGDGPDAYSYSQILFGIVRGPHNVEMEP